MQISDKGSLYLEISRDGGASWASFYPSVVTNGAVGETAYDFSRRRRPAAL